jgi:hypothetical protein
MDFSKSLKCQQRLVRIFEVGESAALNIGSASFVLKFNVVIFYKYKRRHNHNTTTRSWHNSVRDNTHVHQILHFYSKLSNRTSAPSKQEKNKAEMS